MVDNKALNNVVITVTINMQLFEKALGAAMRMPTCDELESRISLVSIQIGY